MSGSAAVTINNEVQTITENQSVFIPLGAIHRISNKSDQPLVLIEVQTGSYLGEDDIIRYEDVYSRGQGRRVDYEKALITGITGQDGSTLRNFSLKSYDSRNKRRASLFNTQRIDHI